MKVERIVLPDDAHLVAVRLSDLLESRTDSRTEWSLEIGEFGDRHRRCDRPLHWRTVDLDRIDAIGIGSALRRRSIARGLLHVLGEFRKTRIDLVEPGGKIVRSFASRLAVEVTENEEHCQDSDRYAGNDRSK